MRKIKLTMDLEILPNELLMYIFEYLTAAELFGAVPKVCKKWALLARKRAVVVLEQKDLERLNQSVHYVRVQTPVPMKTFLNNLAQSARYLENLTMYMGASLRHEHYEVLRNFKHLKHLDVFLVDGVYKKGLLPVVMQLETLVINEATESKFISKLAENKRLTAFHMYGRAKSIPLYELPVLLRACRFQLKELTLHCHQLEFDDYVSISECNQLRKLQLYFCWKMNGSAILQLSQLMYLEVLHITGTHMVRKNAMTRFLQRLPPYIKELDLSVSSFCKEHAVIVALRLPSLQILEVWRSDLQPDDILYICRMMRHLQWLDIDVELSRHQIQFIDSNSYLKHLRCVTKCESDTIEKPKIETHNIRLYDTDQQYSFKCFRGDGEGYRGGLVYYWTRNNNLEPKVSED